ncbi:hypothetical protein ACH4CD_26370 [Streptomyces fungicidicus]|uniref:hypothetical protein n=1 Tax=Streptomyces fungicidicus TaxID=68203 RepID=UPI00379C3D8C
MIATTSAGGCGSPVRAWTERALHFCGGNVLEQPEEPADGPPVTPPPAGDVPEASDAPGASPKRRRGRTAALVAVAAVLGVVAGTCAGYLVQAGREPTELPPLSQPVLAQAKGGAPEPLSADEDRRVKTDGDLRKLLIKKPRGAKEADWPMGSDGWLELTGFAGYYEESGDVFGELVMDGFRRAAVTGWSGNDHSVEIRLIQFRQEESLAAAETVDDSQYWADDENDTDSWLVPGTGEGRVYVHKNPDREPGYEPVYGAEAHIWRGDIAVEIWVYGSRPVPKKMIMDLAERQMERL